MSGDGSDDRHVLDRVYDTIVSRRDADPEVSHTAKLFARGTKKIAQKTGEEATELIIEAISSEREKTIAESADLLYHLMVLWADRGIAAAEIWQELERREGISGITEKASRRQFKGDE